MGEKKRSNAKIIWYILFTIITVIMCYLFTVVYFYFISPNNISLKLGLWPFLPSQTIGEMYLDATVEINFKVDDEVTFEEVDKSVVGVNVLEDGFIVAPYNEFRDFKEEKGIKILTNSGKVFNGMLLYFDMNYNLAVLKCESIDANQEKVKIPFVNISGVSKGLVVETDIIAVSSPMKSKNVWSGNVVDSSMTSIYKQIEIENNVAVDFVMENCYEIQLDTNDLAYTGGAIFNKSGELLGLSFENTLENGNYIIMPIEPVKLFLDNVVSNYKNETIYSNDLVKSIVGFDQIELACFMDASSQNTGNETHFYFDKAWQTFSNEIVAYANSNVLGYYLFEDFVYNGQTIISANNVIASLRYDKKTYEIQSKTDLFEVFYNLKSGDDVTIFYYATDKLGIQAQSVLLSV